MINNIIKQLGLNPQIVQKVMQLAMSKNPQELENYARNLCKTQNKDIDQMISQAKNLLNQFGLKL